MTTQRSTDRILRPAELAERLSVSRATLWRMRRRKEIPEPLRISRGGVGWRESTFEHWLNEREVEVSAGNERPTSSDPGPGHP